MGKFHFRGGYRGTRGRFGGGRNPNIFACRCYNCQEYGHPSWKFPEKLGSTSSGGERKNDGRAQIVQQDEVESSNSNRILVAPKVGESLMMKGKFLKTSKEKELIQRRALFRIA